MLFLYLYVYLAVNLRRYKCVVGKVDIILLGTVAHVSVLSHGYIATKRNLLHFCLSELVKINRFLPHLFTDIQFTVFEKVFHVEKLTG